MNTNFTYAPSPLAEICREVFGEFEMETKDPYAPAGPGGHNTKKSQSTRTKHQVGVAQRAKSRGGEKGDDARAYPRRRPQGWKGTWPPTGDSEILESPMAEIFTELYGEALTGEIFSNITKKLGRWIRNAVVAGGLATQGGPTDIYEQSRKDRQAVEENTKKKDDDDVAGESELFGETVLGEIFETSN